MFRYHIVLVHPHPFHINRPGKIHRSHIFQRGFHGVFPSLHNHLRHVKVFRKHTELGQSHDFQPIIAVGQAFHTHVYLPAVFRIGRPQQVISYRQVAHVPIRHFEHLLFIAGEGHGHGASIQHLVVEGEELQIKVTRVVRPHISHENLQGVIFVLIDLIRNSHDVALQRQYRFGRSIGIGFHRKAVRAAIVKGYLLVVASTSGFADVQGVRTGRQLPYIAGEAHRLLRLGIHRVRSRQTAVNNIASIIGEVSSQPSRPVRPLVLHQGIHGKVGVLHHRGGNDGLPGHEAQHGFFGFGTHFGEIHLVALYLHRHRPAACQVHPHGSPFRVGLRAET